MWGRPILATSTATFSNLPQDPRLTTSPTTVKGTPESTCQKRSVSRLARRQSASRNMVLSKGL